MGGGSAVVGPATRMAATAVCGGAAAGTWGERNDEVVDLAVHDQEIRRTGLDGQVCGQRRGEDWV